VVFFILVIILDYKDKI